VYEEAVSHIYDFDSETLQVEDTPVREMEDGPPTTRVRIVPFSPKEKHVWISKNISVK
jgi:hypothetical protein